VARPFRRYRQHTNEILPVSHDVLTYLDVNNVTLTTAASANCDSGLTISNEAQTTAGWSCLVTAASVGDYSFELWLTYSDGSRQVLEFVIDVVDP
jgi:hypothetical protein